MIDLLAELRRIVRALDDDGSGQDLDDIGKLTGDRA